MPNNKVIMIGFEGEKKPKILFVGTNITLKSYEARFLYSRVRNDFWSLIQYVFNIDNLECMVYKYGKKYDELEFANDDFDIDKNDVLSEMRKQIIDTLHSRINIAVGDLYAGPEENKERVDELVPLIEQSDLIVFNGKSTLDEYNKNRNYLNYGLENKRHIYVRSSSGNGLGGRSGCTTEMRKANWKEEILKALDELGYKL